MLLKIFHIEFTFLNIHSIKGEFYMDFVYPFFIAFSIVFISELGDKTQLLVLSFSSKDKIFKILLGVALGSFFSHGIAILFGSTVSLLENSSLQFIIGLITCLSFILMGILTLIPKKEILSMENNKKENFFNKITSLKINYCLLIAFCIAIGELGDKTFLASIGLGIQYPDFKISLILGAVSAMVICNFIAIIFGRFLNKYISQKSMEKLSGILFLIFGIVLFFSI